MSETGTIVKIASTIATAYQGFTVDTSLYKSYIIASERLNAPIATTAISVALITNIKNDSTCAMAVYGAEPNNYEARCYFSGSTVYLKSKSQYDTATLYGIK